MILKLLTVNSIYYKIDIDCTIVYYLSILQSEGTMHKSIYYLFELVTADIITTVNGVNKCQCVPVCNTIVLN